MLRTRGFTLIEVMVVLAIVAIMAGLVSHSLRPDPARAVQAEAWRMAQMAERLKRESDLSGRVLALRWEPAGYSFLQREAGGDWTAMREDIFNARHFDDGMHLSSSGETIFVPDEDIKPCHWLLMGDGAQVTIGLSALGEAELGAAESGTQADRT